MQSSGPLVLRLKKADLEAVIKHSRAEFPKEACGLLSGKFITENSALTAVVEKVYMMRNVEGSTVSYFMEPKEQFMAMKEMRVEGMELVGIYHSHPGVPAYPSQKDVSLAFYPDAAYLIVSLMAQAVDFRAFQIIDAEIRGIEIQIIGDRGRGGDA